MTDLELKQSGKAKKLIWKAMKHLPVYVIAVIGLVWFVVISVICLCFSILMSILTMGQEETSYIPDEKL